MGNPHKILGAKLSPTYICIGNGRALQKHVSFMSGLRGLAEKLAVKLLPFKRPVNEAETTYIKQLEAALGPIKDALLFVTDYKNTAFIGAVETNKKYFIKYYPNSTNKEDISLLKSYASKHFKLIKPTYQDINIIAYDVINKQSNTSINELKNIALNMCADAYKKYGNTLPAHGDFCHWNVIKDTSNNYILLDYEEVGNYSPFYDYFHLIYKPSILNKNGVIKKDDLIPIAKAANTTMHQVLDWLIQYLKTEIKKSDNKDINAYRQQLITQAQKLQAPNILAVHQGYELYGSDRMFIQAIKSITTQYPKAKITADAPKKGPLYNELKKLNINLSLGQGWVLRKKNFKQGIRAGLKGFWPGLKQAYKAHKKHDIIYINTLPVLNFLIMGMFSFKPKTLHVHEILPSKVMKIIFSILINLSRAQVIFVSQIARKNLYLPFNKTSVLHNCVTTKISPRKSKPHKSLNILIIGRINPGKGHAVLIDALTKLKNTNYKLRILGGVFEGQDEYTKAIKKQISKHNLQSKVEFIDFSDNTSTHYNWADVVVMPSTYTESFGLIVIEAFAYNKLIIASNLGGPAELIEHNKNGYLFDNNNATDLAYYLNKGFDTDLRAKLAQAGNNKYQAKYKSSSYQLYL